MHYWIEGTSEPLTLRQIYDQRHLLSPATRCAVVGSNEWKTIQDIIPDLFGNTPPAEPKAATADALPQPVPFSRHSGWATFFYALAVLNAICGILMAILSHPVAGIISGLSGSITCLFFAFVSQVLVDIRWLLSTK